MSAIVLISKPGITQASVLNVPDKWDPVWFRSLVNNLLKGADVRNAIAGPGITITGNISTPYATISATGGGGGVSSVTASGVGITATPTTGAVVIANTGVTSIVAGTGITISGATGAVTINATGGGSGTVTSVSVVSANGLAGTVATATTTPAITLSTTVTGILYGNGTSIAAATAGEFPTLNQSTTGNAATATTAGNVTGVVAILNGGTGQTTAAAAFAALSPLTTAGDIIIENATPAPARLAIGSTGQVLTVVSGLPSWQTPASPGTGTVTSVSVVSANGFAGAVATATTTPAITISTSVTGILYGNGTSVATAIAANFPTLNQSTTGNAANVTGTVAIANGGTGQITAALAFAALSPMTTAGDIIYENGTPAPARLAIGSTNQVLTVIGGLPSWQTPSAGGVTSVTGTALEITASPTTGAVVLSLPSAVTLPGSLIVTTTTSLIGNVSLGSATAGTSITQTAATATGTTLAIAGSNAGTATDAGGVITITGGTGNTSGAGGAVSLVGGAGGSTGAGGLASVLGGATTAGTGGGVAITAANAVASATAGGTVTITAGNGATSGAGGQVIISGGTSPTGTRGAIKIMSGGVSTFVVTGNVTGITVEGYGPTAGGLVDMTPDSGSFTFTATGMSTTPTGTGFWVRLGNMVLLLLPAITGTSNANTFTYTGLPAEIQAARPITCPLVEDYVENGGAVVNTAAAVLTSGSGTVRFDLGGSSTGWGSTLAKGLETAMMIAYLLT